MEHLHAYWRMEYIEVPREEKGKDLFVKLPGLNKDKETYIIHRSSVSYLILNRFPYNAGHLLAIPYRQVANLKDLTSEERTDLFDLTILGQEILQNALNPNGFNIGLNLGSAGGAGIPDHLHFHIVPRWDGDTNFMPVIGKTRVLPQSLDAMWSRLREFCPVNGAQNDKK